VLVAKVNTDASPLVSQAHQIRSIPTLMVFRDGAPVAQQMGAVPRAALLDLLRQGGAAV
jgi:thioredoxin 1